MVTPTKDNFASYIDVYLSNGNGSAVTATLRTNSGSLPGDVLETFTTRGPAAEGFERMSDSDGTDTAITANDPHWICLDAGNNTNLRWYGRNTGYYNYGYMIHSFPSSPTSFIQTDQGFKTYGYDDDPPPTDPGGDDDPVTEGTTPATPSATVSDEALGDTSELVTKPTSLTAKFVTDEEKETRGVLLSWTSSTTVDIDGYKVFRSLKRSSGYTKIGQTDANIVEFLDDSVGSSTTYYYVVRAFQSTLQSPSSNIVAITTPAGIGPSKVKNVKVIDHTQNSMMVTWDANEEENLTGYVVTAQIASGSKISPFDVEKDKTSYKITGLDAGEIYKISVQAKDDTDALSAKSSVFQSTLFWSDDSFFDTSYTTTALTTIATLLTILFVWMIAKRRAKNKL